MPFFFGIIIIISFNTTGLFAEGQLPLTYNWLIQLY